MDNIETLPDLSHYNPKDIPIEKLIDLRKKGLSYTQMGKVLGISKQACNQRLKPLYNTLELADCYKRNKSEVLNLKQSMLLSAVDETAIKEMQPYQRVVAASILYDKQRLEDGQSTANISFRDTAIAIKESLNRLDALQASLIDNDVDK